MMRTLVSTVLMGSLALAGGCKKDYPQCGKYVDMAMKCDADIKNAKADERDMTKMMLGGMCEEAFKNDTSKVDGETRQMVTEMYAELRTRANCVEKADTCAAYDACTESHHDITGEK